MNQTVEGARWVSVSYRLVLLTVLKGIWLLMGVEYLYANLIVHGDNLALVVQVCFPVQAGGQ